jgi:hypothetical protein
LLNPAKIVFVVSMEDLDPAKHWFHVFAPPMEYMHYIIILFIKYNDW